MSEQVSITLGKLLNPCSCQLILIILFLMYSGPMIFDIYPSTDSYLGGIGFLGFWGVIFSMVVGTGLSMYYGFNCVSNKTVYRCAGFGCDPKTKGLMFPDNFPEELKVKYIEEVSRNNDKEIYDGPFSHFPLSEFNSKLRKLNDKYLYREDNQIKVKYNKEDIV
jgi:hypothetical protein